MAVAAYTPIELVNAVYGRLRRAGGDGPRAPRSPPHLRREDPGQPPPRPAGRQASSEVVSYTDFDPDRVAMQDATAQMALLQFMTAGPARGRGALDRPLRPPHPGQERGPRSTSPPRCDTNAEVYDFLESVSAKYGIGFWKPGAGIIHQVVLENYAFPGGMMIGTDSHTPNAGGLGMVAIGVGGADAVDVMAGCPFNVRWPKLIGVHLTGELIGLDLAKDVILKVAEILTVKGGTGAIVEYFGPGADSISCTGKGTICNMGAEIGATTLALRLRRRHGALPQEHRPRRHRRRRRRASPTTCAPTTRSSPIPPTYFDQVIEIDLSTLAPHINGPHTPDRARPVSELGAVAKAEGWPIEISSALIGSCTNSSYEDITRAASLARQAAAQRPQAAKTPLLVTPGSEQVRATIERDGLLADLEAIGGHRAGQRLRPLHRPVEPAPTSPRTTTNAIVTSYNRNFPKRNDGIAATLAFVDLPGDRRGAGPGRDRLDFDPLTDTLTNADGEAVTPRPARRRASSPTQGFDPRRRPLRRPAGERPDVEVDMSSPRTATASSCSTPFDAWDGNDFVDLPVLMKATGQVHHRPHLDGRPVAQVPRATSRTSRATSSSGPSTPSPARRARARTRSTASTTGLSRDRPAPTTRPAQPWIAIGDENYGEGSSREHAAMEPRFRGAVAILVRSLRPHPRDQPQEAGRAPADLRRPGGLRRRSARTTASAILGLAELAPDDPVRARSSTPTAPPSTSRRIHTMNDEQIEWFQAGGALNIIRRNNAT